VPTDLFCGSLSAGNAINPAAAKQLIKTKRLVFTTYFLLPFLMKEPSHQCCARRNSEFTATNAVPATPPWMEPGARSHDRACPGRNAPLYEITLLIKNRNRTEFRTDSCSPGYRRPDYHAE
jgi:hypothetical protein